MKKKLFMLSGALLVMALSVAIFARKPMTAEEALILRNVEAIAENETLKQECANMKCDGNPHVECYLLLSNGDHYTCGDGWATTVW